MPVLEPVPLTIPQQTVARLAALSSQCWNAMVSCQNDGIDAVWNNPHATAQEVCDLLGTDASAVFDEHGELTDLIVSRSIAEGRDPPIKLPVFAFTRNQDGTVTVDPNTPYSIP